MIGNDVIDLKLAAVQSNWRRKGFMDKIFTAPEKQAVLSSSNPEMMVWLFWSMKEAAYKVYNRATGMRGFFPHKLVCANLRAHDSCFRGVVEFSGNIYHCKTTLQGNQLHTIAVANEWDFARIYAVEDIEVKKDCSGLPYIDIGGIAVPVSKSHHGAYERVVAFYKQ